MIKFCKKEGLSTQVILYGGTKQNGTPTPDAPVDIVCNNGVLKARHTSGLPLGYTELEYIQSDGASYLIVPYRVNNKTVFYARYNEIQNGPQVANAVFGVTDSADMSKANNGILRLTGSSLNRIGWGDNTNGSIIDVYAPKAFDAWYEVLYDQNKLYQDGTLYATSATDPSTVWSANYDLGIFARNSSSVTMPAIAKISSVWAKENGEYKINLVPVKRNSDNVLGMYDLVSGQFFTNQGTGDFVAGTAVSDPVEIYTDGTQETVTVTGKNLFDAHKWTLLPDSKITIIDTNRIQISIRSYQELYNYFDLPPHEQEMQLAFHCKTLMITGNALFKLTLRGGNTILDLLTINLVSTGYEQDFVIRVPVNATQLIFGNWGYAGLVELSNIQLEQGSTATEYEPYKVLGTASAEMLLQVGDYKDTQEVLSGNVSRNVGIKLFDGSETFRTAHTTTYCRYICDGALLNGASNVAIANYFCSHFNVNSTRPNITVARGKEIDFWLPIDTELTDVTKFKQWLSDQYAAGTPVIVVYPLATPTTESVAGLALGTDNDSNVVQTAGSIPNMDILVTHDSYYNLLERIITDSNGLLHTVHRIYIGDSLVYDDATELLDQNT